MQLAIATAAALLAAQLSAAAIGGTLAAAAIPMEENQPAESDELLRLDQLEIRATIAPEVDRELAPTHSLEAVIAILRRHGVKFERREVEVEARTFPPRMLTSILALPSGEPFVIPFDNHVTISVLLGRRPAH